MDKIIKEKRNHIVNWKEMSIEDKILLFIESICYLLTIGTLISIIFVINMGSVAAATILLGVIVGLIGCGLNARSSRNSYIGEWRLSTKMNSKIANKLLSR